MPDKLLAWLVSVVLVVVLAGCGEPRYCQVDDDADLAKWESQLRKKCHVGDVIAGYDRDYRLGRVCDMSKQVVRGSGEWFYCHLSAHETY